MQQKYDGTQRVTCGWFHEAQFSIYTSLYTASILMDRRETFRLQAAESGRRQAHHGQYIYLRLVEERLRRLRKSRNHLAWWFVPATLNEIKHNAQIEFSVVHWKEGNEKRRTFGRSNEAENVFRRAWLNTTSHGRIRELPQMPFGINLIHRLRAHRRSFAPSACRCFSRGEGLNKPAGVSIRGHQIALALSEHKHRAERT